jgi:hypothetical protein
VQEQQLNDREVAQDSRHVQRSLSDWQEEWRKQRKIELTQDNGEAMLVGTRANMKATLTSGD